MNASKNGQISKGGTEVRSYRGVKYARHDRGYYLVGQLSVGEFETLLQLKKYLDEHAAFERKPWDACG